MNKHVQIIAEAGVNHNGSLELAKELVKAAKEAGVDIVKFQTFDAKSIATNSAKMADYQKKNTGVEESQASMLEKLMLSNAEFLELKEYCDKVGITFLSTPFDLQSIDFLDDLQMTWKIPSGEITNYPYLVKIAETNKDIILSTGMCTLEEIDAAIDTLNQHGAKNITVLHCTTNYPTPMNEVNLHAMQTLRDRFGYPVGYSDHTRGIEVPIAAVALGASVIEKHFTLDRNMEGPDHKASLEPDELKAMVKAIRNIEMALGDGIKSPMNSEIDNIKVARKSIVAAKRITKGEIFSERNLTTKRPGTGISPMRWNELIGSVAKKDYDEDDLIEW